MSSRSLARPAFSFMRVIQNPNDCFEAGELHGPAIMAAGRQKQNGRPPAARLYLTHTLRLHQGRRGGVRWWVGRCYLCFHFGARFCVKASMPSPTSSAIMLQAMTSEAYS